MTADLGPFLVCWRRFRRALVVDDRAALDRPIAVLIELVQEAERRAARA